MASVVHSWIPVSLHFSLANVTNNATTALTLAGGQGGDGPTVPTGYVFKPVYMHAESNADVTAGTATFYVTDDGTPIVNGPEPVLSDTVQSHYDTVRITECPGVPAGSNLGIDVTATDAFAPVTADVDAVLEGWFIPT